MDKKNKLNQLRIIAGKWRGRKIHFPDVEGLRPTPDRVRETVFNWLQTKIGAAHCLDLFAGSGALAFEAASRGAETVDIVEADRRAAIQLEDNRQRLSADNCLVVNTRAQQFLASNSKKYDIIFIDPPYKIKLWTEIAEQLMASNSLAKNAIIYLECPSKTSLPKLPEEWLLLKEKKAAGIRYCLFNVNNEDEK